MEESSAHANWAPMGKGSHSYQLNKVRIQRTLVSTFHSILGRMIKDRGRGKLGSELV